MFYLKDFMGTFGPGEVRPLTLPEFQSHLIKVATSMFNNGWTVTGSWFKKACLRPWGVAEPKQLFEWTCADLYSGRANAINLRLHDSNVIAIDCDVYDPQLSAEFFEKIVVLLGLSKEQLFTTVGGKGYKLFFRKDEGLRFPAILAQSFKGTEKQMVEIKSHLSTAVGLYNPDFAIYHPLEGTRFITQAKPQDLPRLDIKTLPHIKRIFLELCADYGYTDSNGELIALAWLKQAIQQVLAKFYTQFKDQLTEVVVWDKLPDEWRAFCKLQGSRVYDEILQSCFQFNVPDHPSQTFLKCQYMVHEFDALAKQYPERVEFNAGKFDSFSFAEYAAFLKLLLLQSDQPATVTSDLDVYTKLLTARGVKF